MLQLLKKLPYIPIEFCMAGIYDDYLYKFILSPLKVLNFVKFAK